MLKNQILNRFLPPEKKSNLTRAIARLMNTLPQKANGGHSEGL
jgi:hypothetical protein